MRRILRTCLYVVCFAYAALLAVLFEVCFFLFLAIFLMLRRGSFEEACRFHNWGIGAYMVRMFWPILRIRRRGFEQFPASGPVVVIANHRSFFDIFFFGFIPRRNIIVFVRSWPFRLPILGSYMRAAGYIDVEHLTFDEVLARVQRLAGRGVSLLCFPEGHRSRDGRLQRFQSGAFRIAAECGLPVVPVCIQGTENIFRPSFCTPFNPARVVMEMLPTVDPTSLPCENTALKLRHSVEEAFKARLGE